VKYAGRMSHLRSSSIRQMLKMASERDLISFAGGLPDASLFPTETLAELSQKIIRDYGRTALQYAPTEGLPALREKVAFWLRGKGLEIQEDQVLITQGSQQGIDLLSKLFLESGVGLLAENPSYLGALQCFRFFEARLYAAALDEEGMTLEALNRAVKRKPRLAYLMPNFQNPTSVYYSLARRKAVTDILAHRGIFMVEDDPYGELIYEGSCLPPLWQFYEGVDKVYLGTFSKTIVPGLRIAYLVGNEGLVRQLALIKQATDLHTNNLGQWIVNSFLEEGLLPAHIELIRDRYRRKRDIMAQSMARHFPSWIRYRIPQGGMFFWVKAPSMLDPMELLQACLKRGVSFVLGSDFYLESPSDSSYLRLNFTSVEEDRIETGISVIGEEMRNLTQGEIRRGQ